MKYYSYSSSSSSTSPHKASPGVSTTPWLLFMLPFPSPSNTTTIAGTVITTPPAVTATQT
ncbi:hypothetical protein E2C01_044354 [Portunus trituberculatus]|uniref:Uncharacterized protein n=1 Tax=Portunus trituberculatus TaxID=210409 RepID=A0A5B7FYZ9_PORTR|nr:hypothetical protein [Portunus trituberculatus]